MPAWLLWLSGIPAALVGAIAWTSWSNRSRGPEQAIDSVQAYERFKTAMSASTTPPRPVPQEPRD